MHARRISLGESQRSLLVEYFIGKEIKATSDDHSSRSSLRVRTVPKEMRAQFRGFQEAMRRDGHVKVECPEGEQSDNGLNVGDHSKVPLSARECQKQRAKEERKRSKPTDVPPRPTAPGSESVQDDIVACSPKMGGMSERAWWERPMRRDEITERSLKISVTSAPSGISLESQFCASPLKISMHLMHTRTPKKQMQPRTWV